ncbi:TPA: ABC transporter permease [Streptococcus suis]|uniref:permease-like cell division protein FtsX n=1 Tax=Streptococcus pluranimalium TaxID=82348 RepID=UPI00241513E3|nr:permease-like cell division protein FtsX [Streptococcus pluranimalium]WFM79220.1 permease-like cell division protein FtsX [Streptococcus pluranimalium]HEM6116290.1 ABC transporter permease [Streptococcus suis]
MIRNFFRHLWTSIKSLKRNGWMTFAAMSTVSITLILVGLFAGVLLNTEKLASGIEDNIQVNVFLNVDSTDAQETVKDSSGKTIVNKDYHKIYDQLKDIEGVKAIDYSSKDEQLEDLKAKMGDSFSEVFDDDANPLYDVYYVKTKSPEDVKKVARAAEQLGGIDSVEYGGADTDRIFNLAKMVRIWGLVGTAILILVAIFLISNTIRVTIFSRSRDIEIMRLVGAKNSYIRGPFFFEGAWIGLLGSILPAALSSYLYIIAYNYLMKGLVQQNLSLYKPDLAIPVGVVAMVAIGIIIGSLGSVLSMRRFLKI